MKVAFLTNYKAPYRRLQFNEYVKKLGIDITIYYTNRINDGREWDVSEEVLFKEEYLKGIKISDKYGYLNLGILKIIKNNDIILLGGYEQPTIIFISIISKILNKKTILIFDGISTSRLNINCNRLKNFLKKIVINNSDAIFANGVIGKKYFNEKFNIQKKYIFNQYLSVNNEKIRMCLKEKLLNRVELRKKFFINSDEKVLVYSGRVIDIKNLKSVINALSKIKDKNITFFVIGGGILEDEIINQGKNLGVRVIVTGFLRNQEDVFKHYSIGDVFILPSIEEPWGLVVNEAMVCGLPVLVSSECGCSYDLVKNSENGFIINPFDVDDISLKIDNIFSLDYEKMGEKSKHIIEKWNFCNSAKSFKEMLNSI
ncbi:glycosyltransferase family 4 protein [Clostridium perfringens]|uniref:glycosyltransferase family 4 protein n=1 Tax=Clostridium perfringens TaxID=1502 RepID=UPI002ACC2F4C|nr:glycosyltransferase family 4 protein [Clostridium perfringens]